MFSGVPFNEKNLMAFRDCLECPFYFAMYRKDQLGELLGYVGAARLQYRSEAEFRDFPHGSSYIMQMNC